MKPKILLTDHYCKFRNFRIPKDWTDAKILKYEKAEKKKDKEKNYDGPLRYLTEIRVKDLPQPLPKKENITFWFRTEKKKGNSSPTHEYQGYCYQMGKWWKTGVIYKFYDLFVPIFDEETYLKIIKNKLGKYLTQRGKESIHFHEFQISSRKSLQRIRHHRNSIMAKFKIKTKVKQIP